MINTGMKDITELTESNFETEVLLASGPVLVDFYAPWCGPCLMLAPLLEQFAAELSGKVKFAKVNIDDAPALAGEYEITGVPTLMLFHGGEPIDQIVGFPGARQFKAWLAKADSAAAGDSTNNLVNASLCANPRLSASVLTTHQRP